MQEHLEGGTLHELVYSRGRLREEEAAPVISNLLNALGALNAAGWTHCDVKPENLMFMQRPSCVDDPRFQSLKLLDFGLSKECCGESVRRLEDAGTKLYQAPELFSYNLYPKSDVWSAGMVVSACLQGLATVSAPAATICDACSFQ